MKKILLSAGILLVGAKILIAQGTVRMINLSPSFSISTNNWFGTTGLISTIPNSYYFALFIDASVPVSSDPLSGGWSIAQSDGIDVSGTNYLIAGSFVGTDGFSSGVAIDGWAAGATMYVEVVGWSANLGTSWNDIKNQMEYGYWIRSGYYGVSGTGMLVSGGVGYPPSGAAALFSVNGISSGFFLNSVSSAPKPSVFILTTLGSISALILHHRRKY